MSELNPWDVGYVAPILDRAAIVGANSQRAAEAGAEVKRRNKALKAEGITPPKTKTQEMLDTRTEENLSLEDQVFYQNFTIEYLRDFNATNAWLRADGPPKSARVRGSQLLKTPYVQKLIQKVTDELEIDNLVTGKQVVMALWREANHYGEDGGSGARVRALMGLARIKKMDVQVVEQKVVQHNVMVVPMAVDNDAWAAAAAESQAQLKSDVRV